MAKLKYIFIILFIIFIFILTYNFNTKITNKSIKVLDLDSYNNLMIVAHPGDELIFGGSHLIDSNYLVVCITCNKKDINTIRVLNKTNDKFLFLNYKDLSEKYNDIYGDLNYIINYKKWDLIVSHNPDGENNNKESKLISDMVSNININNLFYFGKYYSSKDIVNYYDDMNIISDNNKNIKHHLLGLYNKDIRLSYLHIIDYENWISYVKWGTV